MTTQPRAERPRSDEQTRVCYVYGIVPADTRPPKDLTGTGGEDVSLVRHGDLAAVISQIPPAERLGTRDDLLAHEGVVEAVAASTAMLPLRFGAVVTDPEAVIEEMLAPNHDWFAAVLADLTGRREFAVVGTYEEETVLREVVGEDREVAQLRDRVRELPEEATYYDRIRLGELIVHALEDKRADDTERLVEALAPHAVAVAERRPAGEDTAADVAFLVDDEDRPRFERALDELGEHWAGRIRLRLLGPLAPYDFVPSSPEEE